MTLIEELETIKHAMTAQEVGELLGMKPDSIRKLAFRKRLPAFRVGRSVRFDPQELVNHFRKNTRLGVPK